MGKKKKKRKLAKKLEKKYFAEASTEKDRKAKAESEKNFHYIGDSEKKNSFSWERPTGDTLREEGKNLLAEMRTLLKQYLADPEQAIRETLSGAYRHGAPAFFLLSACVVFLEGAVIGPGGQSVRLVLLYVLLSLLYPFVVYLMAGVERQVRFRQLLPAFMTARLLLYLGEGISLLCMLFGFWFIAVLVHGLLLPALLIFDYMTTYALYGGDSRSAVRTTLFSVLSVVLLCLVLFFILAAFSLVDRALGQLLEGGLNTKAVLEFLLRYLN